MPGSIDSSTPNIVDAQPPATITLTHTNGFSDADANLNAYTYDNGNQHSYADTQYFAIANSARPARYQSDSNS